MAWIAYSEETALGIAALREFDLPNRKDLTPWLGGVFVDPRYRNQGIGEALCRAVEEYAKSRDDIEKLYLFTFDKDQWYKRMGWKYFDECSGNNRNGIIMQKNLSAA